MHPESGSSRRTRHATRQSDEEINHVYSRALDDPECQEIGRRGFTRLWRTVAELTGAPPSEVLDFFAHGMLLNVVTALGFPPTQGRDALAASFQTWASEDPNGPHAQQSAT